MPFGGRRERLELPWRTQRLLVIRILAALRIGADGHDSNTRLRCQMLNILITQAGERRETRRR